MRQQRRHFSSARAYTRTHTTCSSACSSAASSCSRPCARSSANTAETALRHESRIARHLSHVTRHASRVTRQSPLRGSADGHRLLHRQTTGFVHRALHLRSPAIRNNERHKPHAVTCVTRHTSYVTRHMSHAGETWRAAQGWAGGGGRPRLRRGGARAKGKRSCNTRGMRFNRKQNRGAKGRCMQGTQAMQGGAQLWLQNRLQQTPKQRTAGTSAAPLVCAGAAAVACHILVACHMSHKHVTCQTHIHMSHHTAATTTTPTTNHNHHHAHDHHNRSSSQQAAAPAATAAPSSSACNNEETCKAKTLHFTTVCRAGQWRRKTRTGFCRQRLRCLKGRGGGGQMGRVWNVTRHTSHVTRHTSHVTRHTSHPPSHVTCEAAIHSPEPLTLQP